MRLLKIILILSFGSFLMAGIGYSQTMDKLAINLSFNPVVDLHFYIRSMLQSGEEVTPVYENVIRQARIFESTTGSIRIWGFMEPLLTQCETAGEIEQWVERLPERFRLRSGQVMALRDSLILPYARELAMVEKLFMKDVWPKHQRIILNAKEMLDKLLKNHGANELEYIARKLNMEIGQAPVPIYLTAEMPIPIASTSSARGIGVVGFVGVADLTKLELAELVLHEATHVLDLRTRFRAPEKPTALDRLRQKLREDNMHENNPLMREIPHMIIFVQAAETVRRLINPEHDMFNADKAFYQKMPEVAELVQSKWKAYLDDQMTLEETLDAIVNGVSSLKY